MNDPSSQGDVPKDSKNHQNKGAPAPRKFLFNTYHTDFKENDPREFFKNSKNPMFMRHIPVINEFPEPRDLKEAYRNICEIICSAYNDVRDLVLRETTEHIKDILKNIKVEGPGDCVKFMRAIAIKCYEKSKEVDQSEEMNKTAQDYEKLLQKSELKIREMIRNEQIYRISFDQYALKDEELERTISELNSKLEENREVLESYAKESAQLRALLHQKEEDIRALAIEKESFLQKLATPQSSNKPKTPENLRSETHRPKAHSLASQNLKTFLKNNSNLASSEALDLVYNVDLTKFLNASKKSNSKTPRTSAGTAKVGHSSAALDVTHGTLKTLKLNELDKTREMRESVKNPGEIPTDRKKLEMSGEQTATNSSRLVEWHNYVRSSKRPSSQKLGGVSDATSKSRSPSHVKFRRDSNHYEGEEKEKTITPGKVRQAEDLQASKIKTDGSDDRSSKYVFIDRVEKGRAGDVDHRPKLSMSQAISSGYKRRSGGLKARPEVADFITNSHERSAEQKSFIINSKYPATHGASVITYRSTSKGRIPLAEHKDNKNTKTNISLMNLMLKKLAEQKSHSKKDLLH